MRKTATKRAPSDSVEVTESEAVDHDDRLILWMLELEPAQRLAALQNFVDGVLALRNARKIAE